MASRPLDRMTQLGVELSAICSRNRYTDDPGPVIDELIKTAGVHTDLLAEEAGTWAGYYDDVHTHALAVALQGIPGATRWVQAGRRRRADGAHSTRGYHA